MSPGTATAAHEMHDFQPVSFVQLSLSPLRSWNNFSIHFDGHAISLHPQRLNELRERDGIGPRSLFSIDE